MTDAIRLLLQHRARYSLVVRARASTDEVALAEDVIDRAGIAPELEQLLDEARPGGSGRPRVLPVRTLLVGLLVLSVAGQPLHLRRVVELLTNLPPQVQTRLGVQRPDGELITERQVSYLFRRICRLLDYSEHTAGDLDDEQRKARRKATQQVMDALLAATLPAQRDSGSYALDATTVPAWARGWRSATRRKDRDAGWSVKRADGSTSLDGPPGGDARPRRGRSRDEFVFGYETHLLTWVRDDGQPTGTVPAVTERITVFGGGKSDIDVISDTVVDALTSPAATQPAGDVLTDRWYTQQRAARFALRVRQAGAGLVIDLKDVQAGPQGTYRGALKVDGELYCPSMPTGLHRLPDTYYKDTKQVQAAEQLAAQRDTWRMLPLASEDPDGFQRMQCPAERGKARCPLKEASLAKPASTTPTVLAPPAEPGACCTQRTIKVPPSVNASTRQKHPWRTAAWRTSYDRRNVVEGAIGVLKTAGGGDVKRDHIRVMGVVGHSLLMAFAVAGVNLQLHARYLERLDREEAADPAPEQAPATVVGSYTDLIDETAAAVARERARALPRGADPPAA